MDNFLCAGMPARLVEMRKKKRWSRHALATEAGIWEGAIRKIENGGGATLETVERLARILEVDPRWLAYGE